MKDESFTGGGWGDVSVLTAGNWGDFAVDSVTVVLQEHLQRYKNNHA